MKYSVAQIAGLISAEIIGDPNAEITTICKIEEGVPGGLTFLSNPKYTQYIYTTKATAAIVNKDFVPEQEVPCTLIKVANSYIAFAQLLNFYQENKPRKTGISDKACIAPTAKIGQNVYIGEYVSIGDGAEIGDGASIYPQTVIGDRVRIGARTTLYAGVKVTLGRLSAPTALASLPRTANTSKFRRLATWKSAIMWRLVRIPASTVRRWALRASTTT